MEHWREDYRHKGVGRWLRFANRDTRPPVEANPPRAPRVLNTRDACSIFRPESTKVSVECSHLMSQWGHFRDVDAWTPYLQLAFYQSEDRSHKPWWAELTVEVRPDGDSGNNGYPCLSSVSICPALITGGVLRTDSSQHGGTFEPSVELQGIKIAPGQVSYQRNRNYARVIEKESMWKIQGSARATQDGDSDLHRQATWRLRARNNRASIPSPLRVGFVVKHERAVPFNLTVTISGALHERRLGDYQFSGEVRRLHGPDASTARAGSTSRASGRAPSQLHELDNQ